MQQRQIEPPQSFPEIPNEGRVWIKPPKKDPSGLRAWEYGGLGGLTLKDLVFSDVNCESGVPICEMGLLVLPPSMSCPGMLPSVEFGLPGYGTHPGLPQSLPLKPKPHCTRERTLLGSVFFSIICWFSLPLRVETLPV